MMSSNEFLNPNRVKEKCKDMPCKSRVVSEVNEIRRNHSLNESTLMSSKPENLKHKSNRKIIPEKSFVPIKTDRYRHKTVENAK